MRILLAFAIPIALAAAPARAKDQADPQLAALVKDFVAATSAFDQARLATLITEDYAEVSPIGELDLRDEFLTFYAPDKKTSGPVMTIGDMLVRRYGDTASIVTTISFNRTGPDALPRAFSVRVGYLAVKKGATWKLASAQYTPQRTAPPTPPPAK